MAPLRIAVVADIHHGRDTFTKKGTAALDLLDRFVDEANRADVDLVLDLGDRISDETPERDRALLTEVAERFARLTVPREHIDGNHDRAILSAAENAASLGSPIGSRAIALGGVRLVLWQPDVALTPERGLSLAPGDLASLAALLAADDQPTILASHVPLSGNGMAGNTWFENNPAHAAYRETPAIRAAIAAAPCPVVALAGHVHWNTVAVVDGTPHLTLQSLTETFTTDGQPSGSSALLEIDGDTLRWTVRGLDPFAVALPSHRAKRRWAAPLPCFVEMSSEPVARTATSLRTAPRPDYTTVASRAFPAPNEEA